MTKIRDTGSNAYIDDRRGQGSAGGGGLPFPLPSGGSLPPGCGKAGLGIGGGGTALLVLLASLVLPRLLDGTGVTTDALTPTGPPPAETCDTQTAQIVCGAVTDVNEFWQREFAEEGANYEPAKTVFYNGYTQTGCGTGQAETGPFYCPVDSLVYFDLGFLEQLQTQFGAPGDLASQYIVAHEYGHHVQNLLGISDRVRRAQSQNPGRANELSVKLELQADCLAGVWVHDANARGLIDPGEIDEALNAAAAVGDDRISKGRLDPDSFTHGSSEQRQTWFRRGYDTGRRSACDTFA